MPVMCRSASQRRAAVISLPVAIGSVLPGPSGGSVPGVAVQSFARDGEGLGGGEDGAGPGGPPWRFPDRDVEPFVAAAAEVAGGDRVVGMRGSAGRAWRSGTGRCPTGRTRRRRCRSVRERRGRSRCGCPPCRLRPHHGRSGRAGRTAIWVVSAGGDCGGEFAETVADEFGALLRGCISRRLAPSSCWMRVLAVRHPVARLAEGGQEPQVQPPPGRRSGRRGPWWRWLLDLLPGRLVAEGGEAGAHQRPGSCL